MATFFSWICFFLPFRSGQNSGSNDIRIRLYNNTVIHILDICSYTPYLSIRRNCIVHTLVHENKRKRKRSDSFLWQKPLHTPKTPKSIFSDNTKTQPKTSITQRLLMTYNGKKEWRQSLSWFGWTSLRDPNLPTNQNSCVIKRTHMELKKIFLDHNNCNCHCS